MLNRKTKTVKIWKFSVQCKNIIKDIASIHGDPTKYDLVIESRGDGCIYIGASLKCRKLTKKENQLKIHNLQKFFKEEEERNIKRDKLQISNVQKKLDKHLTNS